MKYYYLGGGREGWLGAFSRAVDFLIRGALNESQAFTHRSAARAACLDSIKLEVPEQAGC